MPATQLQTSQILEPKMTKKHPFHYSFTTCFKKTAINKMLAPHPGAKILEMGCGSAYFSQVLHQSFADANFQYSGIDLSKEALEAAKQYADPSDNIQHGSVEAIPFNDNEFDDVIYLDVIEHVDDDKKSIEEAFRVVKPGGRLIVSTPNDGALLTDTFWCEYMHDHGHMTNQKSGYTVKELSDLLTAAGFEIKKVDFTNVFLSEILVTITKLGYRLKKKNYASQADMIEASDSLLFKIHKYLVYPIGYAIGKIEEILFKKILKGHCLIISARKPS